MCDGIFAYAEEDTATKIMDESLKICGGSAETLAEVLQKKIIMDRTPLYWALLSKGSRPGIPPLFAKLSLACVELLPDTQAELMEILRGQYDSEIYANVKDRITALPTHEPFNESFFQAECDRPVVKAQYSKREISTATGGAFIDILSVSFGIPKFFDRLTVDEKVWIQFLTRGEVAACFA